MPRPSSIAALALLTLAAVGGVVMLASSGVRGTRGGPAGSLGSLPSVGGSAPQPHTRTAVPSSGTTVPGTSASTSTSTSTSTTSTSTSTAAAATTATTAPLTPVQAEIDEAAFGPLATRLRLRPEQTERVRVIFREGREEMVRRIERFRQEGGPPEGLTRILEEGQARIKAGVRGLLDADQLPLLEKLEAEEAAPPRSP